MRRRIDYDLLQAQKRTLLRLADLIDVHPNTCDRPEETGRHLIGIVELIDTMQDDAETLGLWSYTDWKRRNGETDAEETEAHA